MTDPARTTTDAAMAYTDNSPLERAEAIGHMVELAIPPVRLIGKPAEGEE
jgi:hypothetical protein